MLSASLFLNFLVDVVALFFVAGFFGVKQNRAASVLIITIVSYLVGHFAVPLIVSSVSFGIGALLVTLLGVLFIRLVMIWIVFKTGIVNGLMIWILSAVVSIIFSLYLPL